MATPNLGLNRPLHGTFPDIWDQPVNYNWDVIDASFAATGPYDMVPGTGHSHDGTAGQGPKIRHQDLNGAGVVPHSALDAATTKVKVTGVDTTPDYLSSKLVAGANITLTVLTPGANEKVQIDSTAGGSTWGYGDEYGDKHTMPTFPPVAYTDNFNYPAQTPLYDCDYLRSNTAVATPIEFYTTGYSAVMFVDAVQNTPMGQYAATVCCHIPHGRAQRVTLSITELNAAELHLNDRIEFTLALHSTHTLGPRLPQKIGVLLVVGLVVTGVGPLTFQMTHQILIECPSAVVPDPYPVVLYACTAHTSAADVLGCWELSMDANGHVYGYWRRNLFYSSQTPATPILAGPVAAHFNNLTTELLTLGEPRFGAMGFGLQYHCPGEFSRFNFEFRWLSVTSDSDIYDEITPDPCPGYPMIGLPTIVPLEKEFWFAVPGGETNGVPGAECCSAPVSIHIGDVLTTDGFGNPDTIVEMCNLIELESGTIPGFSTNKSWQVCAPCQAPAGSVTIFDAPTDWPEEGSEGSIILHGVGPLPPNLEIVPSDPAFEVVGADWLNYQECMVKYQIADGSASTPISLTFRNKDVPAISYTTGPICTITNKTPEWLSYTCLDTYTSTFTVPTEGYEFAFTILGSGFDVGCTLTSPTMGVTIVSFNRVSDSRIDAVILFDYDMGTSATLKITNPDAQFVTHVLTINYRSPVVSYPTLNPDTETGGAKTFDIWGNFFAPGITVTVDPMVPPGVINAFAFARIDQHHISGSFTVAGGTGTQIDLVLADGVRGVSVTMPLFIITNTGGGAPPIPPTIASVSVLPTPVYNGGTENHYEVTVNSGGANFDSNTRILFTAPIYAISEEYQTPGNIHTTAAVAASLTGDFMAYCPSGIGNVTVHAMKPGVGTATLAAAFPSTVPGALPVPATVNWLAGLEPGAAGVVQFKFPVGVRHLVEVSSCSPDYITFTGRTWIAPDTVQYNYSVDAAAVEGAGITVHLRNGPCDGVGSNWVGLIEYATPTITSLEIPTDEWHTNVEGYINGTGFRAGAVIACAGQRTFVSNGAITSTRIPVIVNNLAVGASQIKVTNSDGKTTGWFAENVTAEVAPDRDRCYCHPAIAGTVGATLIVYGSYLHPPGAVYSFVGFNVTATVRTLDTYLEFTGDITAPAGGMVTMTITSTANPGGYPPINLFQAEAVAGGAVIITAIGTPSAEDNQVGVLCNVEGENMDKIAAGGLVEFVPVAVDQQNVDYSPVTAVEPIVATIISSTPSRLSLSLNVKKGLAPNVYDMLFYSIGPVLEVTAPSAFTALGSSSGPQISAADRVTLEAFFAAGNKVTGVTWTVAIPMSGTTPWTFGDYIRATGFTLISASYDSMLQEWTVNGTNGAAGALWELAIANPLGTMCTFRFGGGVVLP